MRAWDTLAEMATTQVIALYAVDELDVSSPNPEFSGAMRLRLLQHGAEH
jgi:hypothetical protein